jgi:hypothetical protein
MVIWATLLTGVIAAVSGAIGAQEFSSREQQHTNLVEQLLRSQLQYNGFLSGNDTELALRALRPTNIAMILVRGQDLNIPQYADFSPAGSLQTRVPIADTESGDLGTAGDLELTIRLIGGLLAIGLGIQTVMHAKQTGWLWAMQTLPLRSWQIVLGQWLGCCIVIWVSTAIAIGAAIAAAIWNVDEGGRELTLGVLRAVPVWFLYLSTMAAIGIGLAVWARNQVRAYGAMLLCWLVLAWLGPQFLTTVSKLIRPVNSRVSMETQRAFGFGDAIGAAADELGQIVSDHHPMNQAAAEALIDALHDDLDRLWQQRTVEARQKASNLEVRWNLQRDQQERLIHNLLAMFPGALASRGASDATDMGESFVKSWRAGIANQQETYNRLLFDDRPRATFATRLGWIDPGRQVFYIVRRKPQSLKALPLGRPVAVSPQARRKALLQTNLLLIIHLMLALGIAMRVSPDRLRPAS